MEKEKIVELINKNLSQREIAALLYVSQTSLRHWLKKFKLKTNINKFNKGQYKKADKKICPQCKEEKQITEFYKRTTKGRTHDVGGYCKKCSNIYHRERVKQVKIKMIEYKGSECEKCTLNLKNSHYAVFEFHHINPKIKDINFKRIKMFKWERIEKELKNCILLCSNCHRITHAEIEGW